MDRLDRYSSDYEDTLAIDEFENDTGDLATDLLDEYEEDWDYSVIGPRDDRFPIQARRQRPSTLLFPYNTICFLELETELGRGTGTGTLIAPQVVLTAKHVLQCFDSRACRRPGPTLPDCPQYRRTGLVPRRGPWARRITVTPGADLCAQSNRTAATPASQTATPARFRVDEELDYGVIILPRPFRLPRPTNSPYPYMILQPRGDRETATLLTIAGYPCDKPRGTMWGHSERIPLRDVTRTHLFYTIDTCPGHSGSPIWLLGNNGIRLLLGVHTNGPAGCDNDP
jgi:glutamyl endopeptidase